MRRDLITEAAAEAQSRGGANVKLANISHVYQGTGSVLENLSIRIEPGEFVSILGPSGCGKSTLLRLIAGFQEPQAGTVEVTGSEEKGFKSFVFQEAELLPWRSVLENVTLPLELIGGARSESRIAVAKTALQRVGLEEAMDRYPNELSGGMKMRVSVARALVTKPSLLLLDEPFAALDEISRHFLQEDLRALWMDLKMTVVFVTHSIAEAVFLSDRALVLSARPACLIADQKILLPAERTSELRTDPVFIDAKKSLQQLAVFGSRAQ